jgi:hypothetical protein
MLLTNYLPPLSGHEKELNFFGELCGPKKFGARELNCNNEHEIDPWLT